jgi:GntR family phosphonate transport system transcriptional regulator
MQPTPIWKSIAAELTGEIAQGHYSRGDRLPTEAELAARFGVNRHTVRHALAAMAGEGLVHTRRGAGAFVAIRPVDYPIGRRVRYHENLAAAGQTADRRLLRLETRPADAAEAEALGLRTGDPVHVYEGVSLADDLPLALSRSVFPAALVPGLPERLRADLSITRALAAEGIADYTRAVTRLTAVAATATQALHLRLREGAPLLRSVAVNRDAAGQAVELGTTWWAGDRVSLSVTPENP